MRKKRKNLYSLRRQPKVGMQNYYSELKVTSFSISDQKIESASSNLKSVFKITV